MSKKHRLSRNISRVVALVAIGISVVAATNPSRLLIDSVKEFFGPQDSQRNEYSAETARTVNRPYAPQATLFDSFADGDFTASPVWGGSTGSWTVVANSDASSGATGSNTLRLSAPGVSQTDYLSSQISSW